MIHTEGIDHVAVTVTDLERSVQWYKELFGMEERYFNVWGPAPRFLCVGTTALTIFPVQAGADGPRSVPGRDAIAFDHLAFRVNGAGFVKAQDELHSRGIQFRFEDHDVCHSIHFADPDGHRLEITTYDLA